MNTIPMFSIPLGITTVSQSTCDKLKSLKGVTQHTATDDDFDVLKNYPEIKQEITEIFIEWISDLMRIDTDWTMTTSWIVENPSGQEMTRHNHKNCAYSGVLYFDELEENHPPLIFDNPIDVFNNLSPQNFETHCNQFNTDAFPAPIAETLMIFFPSYLFHRHPKFKASIPRRSLACNFFPIGKYGAHDSTLDTNLLKYG